MKNKCFIVLRNTILYTTLISLILSMLLPMPKISVNAQNNFPNFFVLFYSNLFATLNLMIPFYNIFALAIQIIVNTIIVKLAVCNNPTLIFRVLPHSIFEITSSIIALNISFDILVQIINKQFKVKKILIKFLIVGLLLFIGAIVEFYISRRL